MKLHLCALVLFLTFTTSLSLKNKKVNAILKTKWPAYPLQTEASEFFSRLSTEAFWHFFEYTQALPNTSDKQLYETILQNANLQNLTASKISLLKWSLSIHNENPKIEMYQKLARQEIAFLQSIEKEKIGDSSTFVLSHGYAVTSVKQLEKLSQIITGSGEDSQIFPFDHVYPTSSKEESAPVVFLYGSIGDTKTIEFHKVIKNLLDSGEKFVYIFRHYISENEYKNLPRLNVQGYGIDLALKSLEYKVIDDTKRTTDGDKPIDEEPKGDELPVQGFDFNLLTKNYPESASELLSFKAQLLSAELELEKIKVWELKDLGLVSTQRIIESTDPLRLLRDISQNLPTLAHSLARQGINSTTRASIAATIDQLQAAGIGRNIIWINRTPYDPFSINPFQLYDVLAKQIINFDMLHSLHISTSEIYKILSIPFSEASDIQINVYSDLTEYVNDIEVDSRYQSWHRRVRDLLQPVWPGQFHYVRKNFFNIVLVIDPASRDDLLLAQRLSSLIWQNLPARVGFLFDIVDEQSEVTLRVWKYMRLSWGITRWYQFLTQLVRSSQSRLTNEDLDRAVTETIGSYFETAVNSKEHDIDNYIEQSRKFVLEKGLKGLGSTLFVNGHLLNVPSIDAMIDPLVSKIFELRNQFQEWIQIGEITDDTDIYSFVTTRSGILESFNKLILPTASEKPLYVPLFKVDVLDSLPYLTSQGADDLVQAITHLLVVDLDTQQGKNLALEVIARLNKDNSQNVRVGFIDCGNSNILRAINAVVQSKATANNYLPLVQKLLTLEDTKDYMIIDVVKQSPIKFGKFETIFGDTQNWQQLLTQQHQFCSKDAGLQRGQNAIVTSGRIIVLPSDASFSVSDFEVLESHEYSTRLSSLQGVMQDITYDVDADLITSPFISNVLQKTASLLAVLPDRATTQIEPPLVQPSFEITSGSGEDLSIVAVLDPLSTATQKITPILISLVELFGCSLKVMLNPAHSLSDMPLKNFFRYQMDTISFDENERLVPSGVASFANLPQGRLLSTTVSVPSPWLVLSSKCIYDLDNIVLDNLPPEETALNAEFTLENILLEGSCMDMSNRGVPPRGLELILGDKLNPHQQDSLVMSNLGYFQLKANPGVWTLGLAPGRANTIYQIRDNKSKQYVVKDFLGEREVLHVEKRRGMEEVSLFDDLGGNEKKDEDEIWQKLAGFFGGDEPKNENYVTEKDETIHVFSLASGHLYERFLKIMMLTVIKNTQSPVKFWLLSNFLSPAFKNLVPKMAEKYGFEVELVTYKWPAWLHEQTEKQRIIWGYKILFLDVLFPLNLKRIIYVDADQIVRTDLKELRDMDLKGAPYGYTPFCTGSVMNTATSGFRFWDSGYWRDHLNGKPYHISAIYVVDLLTLRERGYADQLRATYDGLSKDPNSLANLDQDLPNYLQHIVPIYSLPQEWLWCETWCTLESKADAKTIDLCNNPLTKVPKLEAAVRLIPEWLDLDSEVKRLDQISNESAKDNPKLQNKIEGQKVDL